MNQNQEENLEHNKSNEISRKNPFNENTILSIIVFILILNQFSKKGSSSLEDEIWQEDDYTVTMGESPAFPLEKDEEKNKKSILNLKSQQDLYSMINSLKPHMSMKNRKIINIFEKYQTLMEDLNDLSTSPEDENNVLNMSTNQTKNIVSFLYDLEPFIHPEYHHQIKQFSDGIISILDIQKNISNLQNTFNHINSINDNTKKVNDLVAALQPFMGENQRKTINQFKNISQVLEMVKMAEGISENNTQEPNISNESKDQYDKSSQLMEILDIFDTPSENKNTEGEQNKVLTNQDLDKVIKQPKIPEQQYEEVFEEDTLNDDLETNGL